MLEKFKDWYRNLPDKKRYIEFVTAILTVPVLITVIISNVSRINEDKKAANTTPAPTAEKIVIITQKDENDMPEPTKALPSEYPSPTDTPQDCKKQIGPIKISSPKEEEIVQKEPVCVTIDYTVGEYCAAAWSYRLDNSGWSDYTSGSFCFSSLPPGKHELDVRVQSVVSDDETTLERTFYYQIKDAPTPNPTSNP